MLRKIDENDGLLSSNINISNEAKMSIDGVCSTHLLRVWAEENPHVRIESIEIYPLFFLVWLLLTLQGDAIFP